jgi:SAM-dependent methyltransferase
MGDWIAFWNSQNPIYVNARHRDVHYRNVAEDIRGYVPAGAAVLDYGCGDALHANRIAEVAGSLILSDAAPNVRAGLARRFADNLKIAIRSPEEVAALPAGSLDVIVMHSVAQYLSQSDADAVFVLFRRLLKPQGLFVLGDVVAPEVSTMTDAVALLRFAAPNGFAVAALFGLMRTLVSDYGRLRARLGLTRYKESEIMQKLAAAGFSAMRAPRNIGHNRARTTFLARPL